jgi:hypothetical protein
MSHSSIPGMSAETVAVAEASRTIDLDRPVDWAEVIAEINAVLVFYGLGTDSTVTAVTQGGVPAGFTAQAYRRPEELPPPMTREQYDAWMTQGIRDLADEATGGDQ